MYLNDINSTEVQQCWILYRTNRAFSLVCILHTTNSEDHYINIKSNGSEDILYIYICPQIDIIITYYIGWYLFNLNIFLNVKTISFSIDIIRLMQFVKVLRMCPFINISASISYHIHSQCSFFTNSKWNKQWTHTWYNKLTVRFFSY